MVLRFFPWCNAHEAAFFFCSCLFLSRCSLIFDSSPIPLTEIYWHRLSLPSPPNPWHDSPLTLIYFIFIKLIEAFTSIDILFILIPCWLFAVCLCAVIPKSFFFPCKERFPFPQMGTATRIQRRNAGKRSGRLLLICTS